MDTAFWVLYLCPTRTGYRTRVWHGCKHVAAFIFLNDQTWPGHGRDMAHAEKREKKKGKKRDVTLHLHLQSFSCFFSFSHIVSSFFLTFSFFVFKTFSFLELCGLLPLLLTFNLTFEWLAASHFPSLTHASLLFFFFFLNSHINVNSMYYETTWTWHSHNGC